MNTRILSLFVALILCLTMFGCVSYAEEAPVELTIAVRRRAYDDTESYSEKHWVQEAEAACNVKINWIELKEDSMAEQLAAVLAGELPDAFMCGANMTDSLIAQNPNLWRTLTVEEIQQYCPTIYSLYNEYVDGWQEFLTYPDGNIYGLIGSVLNSERHYASGVMFFNHQWVKDLGMETPTTLDELYDVLVAFRDNDMNGNGDASDEYPINFCNNFYASNIISFASWWGLPLSNTIFYDIEDGQVVEAVNTQAFREFLEYFHMLGQEGLLNLEGFSTTSDKFTAECDAMKSGLFGAWAPSYFITNSDNAIQYGTMPSISAEGYEEAYLRSNPIYANRNGFVLSRDCSNVEAALRFYDYISEPTRAIECFLGEEGIFWEYIDDNFNYSMVYCPSEEDDPEGYAAHIQKLIDAGYQDYVDAGVILDGSNLNYYNTAGNVDAGSMVFNAQSYDMTKITDGNVIRVQAIRDMRDRGAFAEPMTQNIISAEKQEEYDFMCDGLDTVINAFVAESIINGVTDESWNAYLAQLETYNYSYYIDFFNDKYQAG